MRVTGLYIYPIKATSATSLSEADVRPRGLAGDRRWVLVDDDGQCLHQRLHPKLAIVRAQVRTDGGLNVAVSGRDPLRVGIPSENDRRNATVWSDTVQAADAGEEAVEWFTDFMGFGCRLLFMDEAARRDVAAKYGQEGDVVSFADAMPLLLCSEASLSDLNRRLDSPLPMSRFRPNVVVDGEVPWAEDEWSSMRVGDVRFEATHKCVRCVVTTIDQQSGEKSRNNEPLKTLATFRNFEGGVCFGQNLIPRGGGVVRLGDTVTVD